MTISFLFLSFSEFIVHDNKIHAEMWNYSSICGIIFITIQIAGGTELATLRDTETGKAVKILHVGGDGALRQHLLDMGIIPGTELTVLKYAPMGDPMDIMIRGYELTLRLADAERIEVVPAEEKQAQENRKNALKKTVHPGLGEGGKFHPKGSGDPLPDWTIMKFALVGNQNCGKTTLFNRLTGSKQHVGNFPG